MILNWLNTSLFGEGAGNEEYALKIVFHTCTDQAYTVLINRSRAREHHPAWLYSGISRVARSAVASHLAETNHRVNREDAFTPIYRVRGNLHRGVKRHLLATAEAIAIRLLNPELCAMKDYVKSLTLPWPSVACRVVPSPPPPPT